MNTHTLCVQETEYIKQATQCREREKYLEFNSLQKWIQIEFPLKYKKKIQTVFWVAT